MWLLDRGRLITDAKQERNLVILLFPHAKWETWCRKVHTRYFRQIYTVIFVHTLVLVLHSISTDTTRHQISASKHPGFTLRTLLEVLSPFHWDGAQHDRSNLGWGAISWWRGERRFSCFKTHIETKKMGASPALLFRTEHNAVISTLRCMDLAETGLPQGVYPKWSIL